VPSVAGRYLELLPDGETGYLSTLTVKVTGRHLQLPGDWTEDMIYTWGSTMGRMHELASRHDPGPHMPTWEKEIDEFRASCRDEQIAPLWEQFASAFAEVPRDSTEFGVIHNDQHLGNLLLVHTGPVTKEGGTALAVIDFDVCSLHWFVADLAIALVHPIWQMRRADPEGIPPFIDTYLAGYTAHFPLRPEWAARLPIFMRYRMTLLVLALCREMGYPAQLPPWLTEIRGWVLSGEDLTDLNRFVSSSRRTRSVEQDSFAISQSSGHHHP
jgi:Ser/Thr protein kinase RdoA (MazF antagonist)